MNDGNVVKCRIVDIIKRLSSGEHWNYDVDMAYLHYVRYKMQVTNRNVIDSIFDSWDHILPMQSKEHYIKNGFVRGGYTPVLFISRG